MNSEHANALGRALGKQWETIIRIAWTENFKRIFSGALKSNWQR